MNKIVQILVVFIVLKVTKIVFAHVIDYILKKDKSHTHKFKFSLSHIKPNGATSERVFTIET